MSIPTVAEVVEDAGGVLSVIATAIADACQNIQTFYLEHGEDAPDPNLSPNLIRWFVKRYLDNPGHTLHSLAIDYEREELSNNGLLIQWSKYLIRVRKAVSGFNLPPATSAALDLYYDQVQLELFPDLASSEFLPGHQNEIKLVLLWEVDKDYQLTGLSLALPRTGGDDPQVFWRVPLNLDDEGGQTGGNGGQGPGPDDGSNANDLDLSLIDDESSDESTGD